ncbi:hypothetical protein COCHEDRAFT_1030006 [Bipolaris maydis C5]|uniref:Uncharacterized protein n=1 Tax=Cochliobolus heterostrophus (strain C5 / ATCC 48332 / race O) TaxID=701091 RepID=M2UXQ7_COCH5|nr:hypothetical protein COCHEDRAFT_1030006 [Bipolaris maydis C5]
MVSLVHRYLPNNKQTGLTAHEAARIKFWNVQAGLMRGARTRNKKNVGKEALDVRLYSRQGPESTMYRVQPSFDVTVLWFETFETASCCHQNEDTEDEIPKDDTRYSKSDDPNPNHIIA